MSCARPTKVAEGIGGQFLNRYLRADSSAVALIAPGTELARVEWRDLIAARDRFGLDSTTVLELKAFEIVKNVQTTDHHLTYETGRPPTTRVELWLQPAQGSFRVNTLRITRP